MESEEQAQIEEKFSKFLDAADAGATFYETALSDLIERSGGKNISAIDIILMSSDFSSGCEAEHLHSFGVLSFGDEFCQGMGCGGTQEKIGQAVA